MAKFLDSENAIERLLTIIALFLIIIAFSSVYYLDSISRVSLSQQAVSNQNALSGYFLAVSSARSSVTAPAALPTPAAISSKSGSDLVTILPPDSTAKQGQVTVFKVKTQNFGDRNSDPSRTKIQLPLGEQVLNIPALAPGSFVYSDFAFECPSGNLGGNTVLSFGDFYGQVSETNEGNNNDVMIVTCIQGGTNSANLAQPDLISRFPDAVNGTLSGRVGSNVTIRESTKNIGTAYAKPSKTKVTAGASRVFNKPGLGVGQVKTDLFQFACKKAGVFPVSTAADYDFKIPELNESNNGESVVLRCA